MPAKIDKKITSYKVLDKSEPEQIAANEPLETMHEDVDRPDCLRGSTYKIKPPQSEHALYITINDIVLNQGTENEELHPFEIFVNSKNMEYFQWVLAFTRVASAVFRKGGDVTFLVDELKAVFDPKGGYWKKGGVFMPSVVAEIGCIIETHLKSTGRIKTIVDEHQQAFIAQKRKEFDDRNGSDDSSGFPPNATLCKKCSAKAVVVLDNCATCLSCLDSKCS